MRRTQARLRLIAAVLVACVSAGPLASARAGPVTPRECVVTGTGVDTRAATLDGLVQAIEQVDGVAIDHKSVLYRRYQDTVGDLRNSFQASTEDRDAIRTASHGLVDHYEVLGSEPDAGSGVRVRLSVVVSVFDPNAAVAAGVRKVIAVLPFRSARGQYRLFDADIRAADLLPVLSQNLVQDLVQSRKFTVLDRDYLAELVGERRLIAADTSPQEQLRLGRALGADFLIVGSIDDLDAAAATKTVQLTGRRVTTRTAAASVAYRVLNVATGKVHWADTYHRSYGEDDFRGLSPQRAGLRVDELLLDDAASAIAGQVVTGVFPVRVLRADGGTLILNQGGLGVTVGQEFDVYSLGPMLFDPDTKEPLEPAETLVARVRVVRVTSKVSYAALVSGDGSKIKADEAVCRPPGERPTP